MRYVDATDDAGAIRRRPHPERVAALMGLGFSPLGLVTADTVEATPGTVFAGDDRVWFEEHREDPSVVLGSTDGHTTITIAGFFGGPSIRVRTALQDGAVVETHRQWDRLPALNPAVAPWGQQESAPNQQARGHAPASGRSIRVVETDDVGALWRTHQDHVAAFAEARGTTPAPTPDLEAWIVQASRLHDHDLAVAQRRSRLTLAQMLTFMLLSIAGIALMYVYTTWWLAILAAMVASAVAPRLGPRAHINAMRISRWAPPPYL